MKSVRFDCEMLQVAHGNTAITLFCMAKNSFSDTEINKNT